MPKETLFSGESINIDYHVINKSIFNIPYLEIQSSIAKELTGLESPTTIISLGNKETYYNQENVLLKRRGFYQLGEIKLTIRDVFGFYSFNKTITSDASLLVYPEVIKLSTFKITASQQSGDLLVQNSTFQDKSRINTLREYHEGDSIKAIHWKLTAKGDTPIIKDYENRGDTHVSIFLDNEAVLYKDDFDRHLEDKVADVALSIINYCLEKNIEVDFETQASNNSVKVVGQHNSELKVFLEIMARFKGNGAHDFKSLISPRIEFLYRGATVIIITPNLDRHMGAKVIDLKMKNLNPLVVVITDLEFRTGYIDQSVAKRLSQETIPLYVIDYSTSIKEALEVYHG